MASLEVGKAYRGQDGIVRWVTHKSSRGYYHLLWLDEGRGLWYEGGRARDDVRHIVGVPYPAPKEGETYTLVGALGSHREMVAREMVA